MPQSSTTAKTFLPYGTWPSTINSDLLTRGITHINEPTIEAGSHYWLESRPENKGRTGIVKQTEKGEPEMVTPAGFNVRTRIHEYGGGSYCIHRGIAYFCNDEDQRVYALDTRNNNDKPRVLSPPGNYRYADFCVDENNEQLICVCEIHKKNQAEPENCIITLKLDGSSVSGFGILVFGNDFYSNPRVSPDGHYLSWLTWKHPNMPWDNSECWMAELGRFGLLQKQVKVAGGVDAANNADDVSGLNASRKESIFQPQWSPTGELFFVSDRNNWWNLYRFNPNTKITRCVLEREAEFATPQWVFGMSTYGFLNSFTLLCCYTENGRWYLAKIDTLTSQFTQLVVPYSSITAIACDDENDTALFIGAHESALPSLVRWREGEIKTLSHSASFSVDKETLSRPQALSFTNQHQQAVFGFYYPPHNPHCQDEPDNLPPLLVVCHGGPTGATSNALNFKIQYWTSRGFAVFDINYSGSTGYGRAYRDRLKLQWGVLDVEDICSGANYLVEQGWVDPKRLLVRGSSAGGYSVLAALTFRDTFMAGASLYGIGDLHALAKDTHKFESRYLDQLIGPYPKEEKRYSERSPLFHAENLNCPVIFLQGLEDKVVPPNQAVAMVNALVKKHIPVAYVTYAEEGHGFRQAENIRHAIDVEYAFYLSQFGLAVESALPEVPYITETITEES